MIKMPISKEWIKVLTGVGIVQVTGQSTHLFIGTSIPTVDSPHFVLNTGDLYTNTSSTYSVYVRNTLLENSAFVVVLA